MTTPRRKNSDVDSVSILPSIAAPMIFISHDTRDAELAVSRPQTLSHWNGEFLLRFAFQ